jgi:hypothetical protein
VIEVNDPTMNDRDPLDALDDAIDRTVRDMTHAAADEFAVGRVMARVRNTDARKRNAAAGKRWVLSPRVAWCGILAILLMAIAANHSRRWFHRGAEEQRAAVTAPIESSKPPQTLATREFPTRVTPAPSTTQATTAAAQIARRGDTVRPASVANDAADVSIRDRARIGRNTQPELPPFESDIEIASITPAPLGEASAISVEPLITSSLTVDEIPVSSIEMPPVSPEQQK